VEVYAFSFAFGALKNLFCSRRYLLPAFFKVLSIAFYSWKCARFRQGSMYNLGGLVQAGERRPTEKESEDKAEARNN
jgi:hypothetical protein